jgi:hypothetical protein
VQVQFNLQGLYLGGRKEGTKYDAVAALVRLFLGPLFQKATAPPPKKNALHGVILLALSPGISDFVIRVYICLCFVWGIPVH